MSDERLRELERVWRESGDPQDEARFLLERVRGGDLAQLRLELAAFLGHAAARHALGDDAPMAATETHFQGLNVEPWGKEAGVRMAIAAARLVLPDYEAAREGERRPRVALEAAEAWVREPSDRAESAARDAADATESCFRGSPAGPDPVNRAFEASTYAARAAGDAWSGESQSYARWAVEFARQWLQDEGPVHAALSAEVIPWALGTADSVAQ